jgi:hypothetical protein
MASGSERVAVPLEKRMRRQSADQLAAVAKRSERHALSAMEFAAAMVHEAERAIVEAVAARGDANSLAANGKTRDRRPAEHRTEEGSDRSSWQSPRRPR